MELIVYFQTKKNKKTKGILFPLIYYYYYFLLCICFFVTSRGRSKSGYPVLTGMNPNTDRFFNVLCDGVFSYTSACQS